MTAVVSTEMASHGLVHSHMMDDGISYGNRWGLKGREDLGGGNYAVFVLESGFKVDTGRLNQGGALFGRQAYVGVGNTWGTLTLGNQYDFAWDFVSAFSPGLAGTGYGGNLGDVDRPEGDRLQNSIKFVSNAYHGLVVGGMYSFSNTAGDFRDGSAWGLGAQYKAGAFAAGANYTRLNSPTGLASVDPYAQFGITSMLGQTVATVNPATGIVTDLHSSTAFAIDSQAIFGIGTSYSFGKLTVLGDFSNTTFKGFGQSSTMRVYEPGLEYQATAAVFLAAGYQYTTFEGYHWNQGSFAAHYLLSSRTDVYAGVDWQRASNGAHAVIGYNFSPSSGAIQTDVRIGLRHSF